MAPPINSLSKAASKLTLKDFFLFGVISGILTKTLRDKRKKRLRLGKVTSRSKRKSQSKSKTAKRSK